MKLLLVLALLTAAVVAQETRWAPIPKSNTLALWASVFVSLVAYFILRSGWGRTESHLADQEALGTVSNTFYEPRRSGIEFAFGLTGGILAAMWWGATSWLLLVKGMDMKSPLRGLISLQVSVTVGALAGGIAGAALGLAVGELWERRHRRRRTPRS